MPFEIAILVLIGVVGAIFGIYNSATAGARWFAILVP